MAHRGRLSVLAHGILGRSVESILAEFEGAKALDQVKAIADPPLGHGRRQVPPTARRACSWKPATATRSRSALPEPEPSRVRRPGGDRGARAAQTEHSGLKLKAQPARGGCAAPARRRLPRPGGCRGDAQPASVDGYSTRHGTPDRQPGFTTDPRDYRSTPYAGDKGKGLQLPDHPRERRRRRGPVSAPSASRWPIASSGGETWSST